MKNFCTLKWAFLLLCCLAMQVSVYGQSQGGTQTSPQSLQINLDGPIGRYNFDVDAGVSILTICNLEVGQEYGFFIRPDEVCDFGAGWADVNAPIWEGSNGIDYHYAETKFIAKKTCTEIQINTACAQSMRITAAQRKSKKETLSEKMLASIQIDQNLSTAQLIEEVFIGGGCYEVSNISAIGSAQGRGHFTQGTDAINIDEGVILSSGNVNDAEGPNNSGSTSSNLPGAGNDVDLAVLATGTVRDAAGIEFDFTPSNDTIRFDYVFASEEYCEFVFANVNDAFGFFISGPGFNGPYSGNGENIALIPGTTTNVTIDDVNDQVNTNFFVSNSNSCDTPPEATADIEYDGFTTVMTAVAVVQPCETYHIRLVVSDVGDSIYDSAVFLGANSFDSGGLADATAVGVNGGSTVYEGCEDGQFVFTRANTDVSEDLVVNFTISPSSTASDAIDYSSLPTSITIPAGQLSYTLFVEIFADLIAEGQETIILELDIPCLCSNPIVELVIEDVEPIELEMDNQIVCGTSANLSPSVSGGVPNYYYEWDNGQLTPSITVTTPGTNTYEVTVTDDCGAEEIISAEVTLSEAPTADLTGGTEICANGNTDPIDIEINFTGTAPWEIIYSIDGVNQPVITTSDNPYIFQATDASTFELVSVSYANGDCPGTVSGDVIITEIEVIPTLTPTPIGCNGDDNGEIAVSVSGGTPTYTYTWSDPSLSGDNPGSLPDGMYDVTVVDMNGCEGYASTEITEPPLFEANVDSVTEVDCNNPDGNININVSGGTPNYNFNWTGGASGQNPGGLDPGIYDVTVSDDEGCEVILQAEVVGSLDLPDAVAVADGLITCLEESITVDGTGSSVGAEFEYNWTGPGVVSGGTTLTPEVDVVGAYTLTVTNTDTGCEEEVTVNVDEDIDDPDVMAVAGEITCTNETIFVDGTGTEVGADITYLWTTTDGNILNGDDTLTPEVDAAGTYTLTVMNGGNGCDNSIDVTITENNDLPDAVANAPQITCAATEISIDGNGSATGSDITYDWTTPDGNIVSGGTTLNPTVDMAGTYTILVVNGLTGCENTATVTVEENNTPPDAVANFTGQIDCITEEITIDGIGSTTGTDITYDWTGPSISSGGSTLNPIVDGGGTYVLTVTNGDNGCEMTAEVTIPENIDLPDAVGDGGEITCDDEIIFVDGTGSSVGTEFDYNWTTTDGNILSGDDTLNPEIDAAGTYTLTVTNTENGCEAMVDVPITENNDLPEAVANAPEITCADPIIDVDGNGSATGSDITYTWTTPDGNIVSGDDTINPTVDMPGTYTITVVNAENGCENTDEVTVIENNTPPDAVANFTGQIDCITEEITIDGVGSTIGTDVTYDWTGPSITAGGNTLNPTVDAGGTYILTVTNGDNGCEATAEVTIPENQDTPDAVAQGGEITCTESNIFIDGIGSSTGGNISYDWTTTDGNILSGDDTLNPLVDAAGTYTLTVTNGTSGCDATIDVTITESVDTPDAVANAPQINCSNPQISIDGNGSEVGPDITYTWTTPDGNIVSGGSTLNPVVDEAGTYTLSVENGANGCDNTVTITIDENTTLPDAVADAQGILDCLNAIVEIHGVGSSTGSEFDYNWTGPGIVSGGNTLFPEVDAAGTYTLTVLNTDTGCEESVTVEVDEDQDNPIAQVTATGMIDCTTSTISLNGNGSSIGPNYTLLWETIDGNIISGINSLNPIVNEGGTYTLTVTNVNNGCEDEAIVTIDEDTTNPLVVNPQLNPINCSNPTINLNAIISNAGPNPNIQWTGPGLVSGTNTATPEVDASGMYTITVTNPDNGCDFTTSLNVLEDLSEPIADAGPMQELGCTSIVVALDGTGSNNGAGYNFEWTTTDGNISSNINSLQPIVDQPGTYTLTITDLNNGCDAESTVEVTQDNIPPIAVVASPGDIDCNNTELTISAQGSSEGSEFIYEWIASTGNIVGDNESLDIVVDEAGVYTFYVYNTDNWCEDSYTVFIDDESTELEAEAGSAMAITCDESEVELSGSTTETGNIEYQWTSPSGNILSGGNTLNPMVNEAGTYVLTVTNLDNGCTGTDETTVTANSDVPEADAGPNGLISCLVDEITLDGTNSSVGGDVTYTWNTTDGNIIAGENSLTPTVDASGTYELIVTNNLSQCTAISTAIVTVDTDNPDIVFEPAMSVDCENPMVSIDASNSINGSDYEYTWTTADGNILDGAGTLEIDVDEAGTYTLTVLNTLSGCEHTDQIIIDENVNTPTVLVANPDMITCQQEEVMLNANGSSTGSEYQLTWTTDGGNFVSNETTLTPTVNAAGEYTLTILNTDSNCEETQTITVEADAAIPEADAGQGLTLDCVNTSTVLTGVISGGANLDYTWATGDGTFIADETTLSPEVSAGTYVLTVLNTDNNCTAVSSVTIENDAAVPEALIAEPGNIDCLNTSVQLDASASSNGNNITYAWTTADGNIVFGEDTENPIVDGAGIYTLTVTNSDNNCTDTEDIEVMVNAETPDADVLEPQMITCQASEITLDGSGSQVTSNATIEWTTSGGNFVQNQNTLSPLVNAAGDYTLTIFDTLSLCFSQIEITVEADANIPEVDIDNPANLDCEILEIDLSGTITNGTNFDITWTTPDGNIVSGGTTLNPMIDAAGTYTLTVLNTDNNCTAVGSVDVENNATLPDALIANPDELDCNTPSIQLDASSSTNGTGYEYTWTTADGNILSGANSLSPFVDETGTYTLTILNTANNCENSEDIIVTANAETPDAVVADPDMITCQLGEFNLDGSGSQTTSNATIEWTTIGGNFVEDQNTLNPLINAAGEYTLSVYDTISFCVSTQMITVEADANIPEVEIEEAMAFDCQTLDMQLTGSVINGTNFDITWTTADGTIASGGTTLNPTIESAGTYTLSVLNTDNNCTAVSSVEVEDIVALPTVAIANPNALDCINTEVELDGSDSSNGTEFTYTWTTTDGNIQSGADSANSIVDETGTYTLTILNTTNNCESTDDVIIIANADSPDAVIEDPDMITCTENEIIIEGINSQLTNNAVIDWATTDGSLLQNANTLSPTVGSAGTYVLTITDTLSQCVSTAEIDVAADANIPTAMIDPAEELTCTLDTLVLNALAMNGTNFEYEWTTPDGTILNGSNTLNPTIGATGTYIINVLNLDNACETNASIEIESNTILPDAVIVQPDTLTCDTENLFLDAMASSSGMEYSYAWFTTNGTIIAGEATNNPVVADPGLYTLLVTNETTGCVVEETVEVFQNADVPTAVCEPDFTIGCTFNTLQLSALGSTVSADVNYFWVSSDDNIVGDNTIINPTIDGPGTFTLTVTNILSGCQDSDEVIVIEDVEAPALISNQAPALTCDVQEVTIVLNVDGNTDNFAYEWTTPDGNIVEGAATLTPTVDAAGVYEVLVTDTLNSCFSLSEVIIEEDDNIPDAMAVAMGDLTCTVNQITLNGDGSSTGTGYTFEWTTTDGTIVSGDDTLNPTVSEAGVYTLSVYDADNCVNTATVTVDINEELPTVDPGALGALTCAETTTMLDASNSSTNGDFTYNWTTTDGTIDTGADGLTPIVSEAGTYLLTILNNENGCALSESVEVVENFNLPNISLNEPEVLNCTVMTSDLLANVDTDDQDYTFAWTALTGNISNGETTLAPEVNMPGTYEIEVFNTENECITTQTVTVLQDIENPDAQASTNGGLDCDVSSLELSGAGTSIGANFEYAWTTTDGNITNNATALNPTIDEPGTYQILVTNTDNNCTNTAQVNVTESADVPDAFVVEPDELNCAIGQILLNGNGSSQGANFDYIWTTANGNIVSGATTLQPSIDEPGQYVLNVNNTDNGCDETYEVTVIEDIAAPSADAGTDVDLPCTDFEIIMLDASGSTQGANITYAWGTLDGTILIGDDTQTPEVGASGVYTILVTNTDNGCSNIDQVEVRQNNPIEADALGQNPACEIANGSIIINDVVGGTAPIVYSIDGGQSFQTANEFNGLSGGNYAIVVEDANGCLDELDITLDAPTPVNVQVSADATIQLGDEIQLSADLNLPLGQVQVVWTPSEGLSCANCLNPTAAPLTDTEYTVTVISADGCLDEAKVRLSVEEVGGVYVPNGFSPDFDGTNDIFYIQAKPGYVEKVNSFLVYSRWGETVYQYYDFDPNNPAYGWDGTHKGEDMNPAVFGWWAEITLANGEVIIVEGDVTLVR